MLIERTWLAGLVLFLSGSAFAQDKPSKPNPRAKTKAKPIRVLYVEDVPRWEYRYIKNGLLRIDENIQLRSWLCDASGDFHQEHSKTMAPLKALPRTAKELAQYDVILIGDVPRKALGKTAKAQAAWCKAVVEFVSQGGGVAFLAGAKAMPEVYRGLFDQMLLPVILEPPASKKKDGEKPASAFRHAPFRPTPVVQEKKKIHPILRFKETDEESLAVWSKIPGLHSYLPVRKLKLGARAILQRPGDKKDGSRVIAAVGKWGKGRTFFIASEDTWLWRKPHGEYYQDTFWRNVVYHLAHR